MIAADLALYSLAACLLFVALRYLWADWMQTRWISKFGAAHGIFETNVILGRHPSIMAVNLWFAFWIGGLFAAAFVIPPEWSAGIYLVVALVERHFVISNQRIGVGTYPLWS